MIFGPKNTTAFDYLEVARSLNLLMQHQAKTGKMTVAWFIDLSKAQVRNIEAIEDLLINEIAERNDIPEAFTKELDRKIQAEFTKQNKMQVQSETGNVVQIGHGSPVSKQGG